MTRTEPRLLGIPHRAESEFRECQMGRPTITEVVVKTRGPWVNRTSCTLLRWILLKVIWIIHDRLGRLLLRCRIVRTPHRQQIGM